jgi:hypothetical protein
VYDLIYTDTDHVEQGVLDGYALTMTFGDVENTFDCVFGTQEAPPLVGGCLLYAEDTEYGGIVRAKATSTQDGTTTFSGSTWHGVINEHILCPPAGETHLKLRGDAHTALRTVIEACGIGDWFEVAEGDSGITVSADIRYRKAYDSVVAMLAKSRAKLVIKWKRDHAELSVVAAVNHNSMNSDNANFTISKGYRPPNHMILLGTGEMLERITSELFIDENGEISRTQYYTGLDEVTEKYEDTNAQLAELEEKGADKLLELQDVDEIDVSSELVDDYDVGDYVTATNLDAGQSATAAVTSKTVTLIDGNPTFSCEIGSASALFELNDNGKDT